MQQYGKTSLPRLLIWKTSRHLVFEINGDFSRKSPNFSYLYM